MFHMISTKSSLSRIYHRVGVFIGRITQLMVSSLGIACFRCRAWLGQPRVSCLRSGDNANMLEASGWDPVVFPGLVHVCVVNHFCVFLFLKLSMAREESTITAAI